MQMATRIICCKFWSNTWVFTSDLLHWNIIFHKWQFAQDWQYFSHFDEHCVGNVFFQTGRGKHNRTEMQWMHLCSLSRLSVTKESLWEVMNTSLKCHNVGDVRKTTPRVPPSLLSDPVKPPSLVSTRPENWGGTEKFRVRFPILTDKFLEMLEKHFLDPELRCERARRLILRDWCYNCQDVTFVTCQDVRCWMQRLLE